MTKHKYLLILIAVALVAVTFAGCTSSAPATITPAPTVNYPNVNAPAPTPYGGYMQPPTTIPTAYVTRTPTRYYEYNPSTPSPTPWPTQASGTGVYSVSVKVIYSGSWSGAVGDMGSIKSVDGSGSQVFKIPGVPQIVSASFQKKDDSSSPLTVQIIEGGTVIKDSTTTAAYGVATVAASL